MDSCDSEKRYILQRFWRYTRFAFICTAPKSSLQSFRTNFRDVFIIFENFDQFSFRSVIFRRDFRSFSVPFLKKPGVSQCHSSRGPDSRDFSVPCPQKEKSPFLSAIPHGGGGGLPRAPWGPQTQLLRVLRPAAVFSAQKSRLLIKNVNWGPKNRAP